MGEALVVDLKGLAKLVERRGKSFAILELVQNAWDENVTRVDVRLFAEGRGQAFLEVEDDSPEGFRDLSHAFTLFAESYKKSDPEKRGRFNLGEKLVIALANTVEISTTTGTVLIDVRKNSRMTTKSKRSRGTLFRAYLRMTKDEIREAEQAFRMLIPPLDVETTLNGVPLQSRIATTTFDAQLATEIADDEGYLRPTRRVTTVQVYEPLPDETAMLYELGIPVVETDDRFHVNVMQKVPLNSDRDNVTPSYLRDLRAHVLNNTADLLSEESAAANWVNEALEDDLVEAAAVERVLTKRFGERRVIFDPSDPEANRIAMAGGYTVIPGRSLSKAAWANVKSAGAAFPAGQVTPSPKPYSEDGKPLDLMAEAQWTDGMRSMAMFAKLLASYTLGKQISVTFANDAQWPFRATFGTNGLVFNVGSLGYNWFDLPHDTHGVLGLLIHEFAHVNGAQHMSKEYDKNLSNIGAHFTRLALEQPEVFA